MINEIKEEHEMEYCTPPEVTEIALEVPMDLMPRGQGIFFINKFMYRFFTIHSVKVVGKIMYVIGA